ncbi:MAG: hypothetical protein HQL58_08350 [Magnetococcales bacterium]|nr:hypothetical protein [Magnetococcales bacterium]
MPRPYPELTRAISCLLDRIDAVIRHTGYGGAPVRMYLAGGIAVNYYCGSRHTEDVDASFSHRILLPYADLVVDYQRQDGGHAFLYLDQNYNSTFALTHEDHEEEATEWAGIGNENRLVHLYVLAPVDLAISKVARLTAQDQEDILDLARAQLVTADRFERRAQQALSGYIGDTVRMGRAIQWMANRIRAEVAHPD